MAAYEGEDSLLELFKVATWMNQDHDLWLCRRFESLHVFNILSIQQRLAKLERQLGKFIELESRGGDELSQGDEYSPAKRESLVKEIQANLKAYDEAILSAVEISRFQSPAAHTIKVVYNTVMKAATFKTLNHELGINRRKPSNEIDRSKLLAVLTPQKSWFHKFIDSNDRLRQLFAEKSDSRSGIEWYSESKIRTAEFVLISATFCLVQMLPIAALTLVQSRAWKLVIIFILIIIVSILTSLFANTTRASNFGAVAAYSAIVVAFIGKG
ncbi:hypothetical protein AOQ84DRAFT_386385 [Glonium stellatum]|uniref:DUF6594 domain-containing protein n=1 Tax=Glonium stellatum TaxID=574774 RepID=A0A8E2JWD0_9PEZI|nr:hypothetical protein AOQ84DRAFT_386385 [Glonium stellatum]